MTPTLTLTTGLPCTDVGNGERFIARWGNAARFVPGPGWYVWDGRVWLQDDAAATRLAKATAIEIGEEAQVQLDSATDPERYKKLAAWALTSQDMRKIKAMLAAAEVSRRIRVDVSELDADPWLLNVRNGTVDLRTGKLLPHDPANLITRLAPVDYCPDYVGQRWPQFLAEIMPNDDDTPGGDPELMEYLARVAGMSLVGVPNKRMMVVLYGPTARNGKSKLIGALQATLGDYSVAAPVSAFMQRRGGEATNDLAILRGPRMVHASELDAGQRFDASTIKRMTGGDPFTVRFLRKEHFTFTPVCTIWMGTNELPGIPAGDQAMWDRVNVVPFNARFAPGANNDDPDIEAKLHAEREAILAWAVRGCLAWQAAGQVIATPRQVREATKRYRDDADYVGQFLADACLVGADEMVSKQVFSAAYGRWCRDQNVMPLGAQRLKADLLGREISEAPRRHGHQRAWQGVRVKVADMLREVS